MHTFKRFSQGDKVTYIGSKYAAELSGSVGVVDGHVQNADGEIVVSFGTHSYVMDENRHLTKFQGKMNSERSEKEQSPKDVEVTKRRGGKRRSDSDSE